MMAERRKKLIGLLVWVFCFFSGVSSVLPSVKPGLKGGLSFIGMDWNNPGFSLSYRLMNRHMQLDYSQRIGFQVGGFCRIPILKFLSVQPEAGLIEKGLTAMEHFFRDKLTMSTHVYYLDFPVLVQFHFKIWGGEWGVFVGPYGAVKIDEKVVVSSWDRDEVDKSDHFKKFDYGLVWGLFRRFKVGKYRMLIEFRQNFGLQNPFSEYEGYEFWRFKGSYIRHDTISLMVGMEF